MFATYHSHSSRSDGDASIAQMISAAEAAGFAEFGVSDHYVLRPDGKPVHWSMPQDMLPEYVAEVQREAQRAAIPVRLGVEVDFFPETVDVLARRLEQHPFDYVIGSVHYVGMFPVDGDPRDWEPLTQSEIDRVYQDYWKRVRELAESRLCDFLGHLDLPKKFGFYPSVDLSREIAAALDSIAAADAAIEVNTAGWDKTCAEAYPSEAILRGCLERGILVLINDDSHRPAHLGRHYTRAVAMLRETGFSQTVRFVKRQRLVCPLGE